MNIQKLKTLPALLLCCVLLCACGRRASETVHVPAPTPTADLYAATPTPAPTPPLPSESEQRALIERSRSLWEPDLRYETWYFAVTDLDHNGRLEVLTASLQGTGLFTYVECREVNESGTGLTRCPDNTEEGEAWPDIIKDTMTFYRDPVSGRYSYICEDYMRDGMAHNVIAIESFCLDRGQIELRTLASRDESFAADGSSQLRYYGANREDITADGYNGAEQNAFAGQERGTLTLNWTQLEARPEPTPAAQPQFPAGAQSGGPVTITKNPTSESLAVGGKAWFIAHADNATGLTWLLTSPQGETCTLEQAMNANPGLRLEALPDDTLGISNVPASVNGWSVQARFDGPGGSAVTSPAMIYVDDYVTSYGSVLSSYYYAYANGITDPAFAYDRGISEYFTYSDHAGYALRDLDGDGTKELIVAGMGENNNSDGVIYEIDTLVNGQPVQILCSSARDRYYLRTDGSILNEGSGGAGHTVLTVSRVSGSALQPYEAVITWFDGTERDGYYHQLNDFDWQPRDYDDYLTEEQFNYFVRLWEDSVFVPELTQFA